MMSVSVFKDGVLEAIGVPDCFCRTEDFEYIVSSESARSDLVNAFYEGVVLGILGTETSNGFIEDDEKLYLPDNVWLKGDLGFYERIS